MLLDNPLGNIEAKPRAVSFDLHGILSPEEPIKDIFLITVGNSNTSILYRDLKEAVHHLEIDLDGAVLGSVFDGILQKILDCSAHLLSVDQDLGQTSIF